MFVTGARPELTVRIRKPASIQTFWAAPINPTAELHTNMQRRYPRLAPNSLHPGNGGNPAFGKYDMNSNMRIVFYPAVIGWILMSIWLLNILTRIKKIEHKKEYNEEIA